MMVVPFSTKSLAVSLVESVPLCGAVPEMSSVEGDEIVSLSLVSTVLCSSVVCVVSVPSMVEVA